ncbi:hypothetical protein [Gordonibacter sp.]|uniref:hypothetical protein n=3 Tax=Gordonibacter sp. TaxID=1968902 RepID=UPI002FC77293
MTPTRNETMSPTRTKATWKPGVFDEPVPFFRCPACHSVLAGIDGGTGPCLTGGGRRPVAELPYAPAPTAPHCCGTPMERLPELSPDDTAASLELSYDVVGGFDTNALRVSWSVKQAGCTPRWFALKTFTGLQLKYVVPGKLPPVVFALADEDAYAYCDENPCLSCTFHCKRGFVLYAYVEETGLVAYPVHCEAVSH